MAKATRRLGVGHAGTGRDGLDQTGDQPGIWPGNGGDAGKLDACGMVLSPTWRHFDRGSGEPIEGSWTQADRVFGATGAASLFRRQALEDVAIDGEIFLSEFHSFREDAELCFRFHERGWEVLYEPAALCEHRRYTLPSRRRRMPPHVNMHSLKNRYLLRLYHQNGVNLLLTGKLFAEMHFDCSLGRTRELNLYCAKSRPLEGNEGMSFTQRDN